MTEIPIGNARRRTERPIPVAQPIMGINDEACQVTDAGCPGGIAPFNKRGCMRRNSLAFSETLM
jgi:hypothetical protein